MPTQPSWYNASLLAVEEEETEGLQVFFPISAMTILTLTINNDEDENCKDDGLF